MCADIRRWRAARHAPRGQALVELLVASAALLPLFFGIAWLAKVLDMQQATIAAARSLAFECTVRLDACRDADAHAALTHEVRRRHFAAHSTGLRSDQRAIGAPARDERNPAWTDRRGEPLLERFDDVVVTVAPARFDSPLAFAGSLGDRAFPGAVGLLSELGGPRRFGLELEGGFVDARVAARVSRDRPADGWTTRMTSMPLTLNGRLAILTDAWNASGPYGEAPDSVETRVDAGARLPVIEPAVDTGWLAVRGLLWLAGAIGFEPSADTLRWHEIDVDRVPPDRLRGGEPPTPNPADPPTDRP